MINPEGRVTVISPANGFSSVLTGDSVSAGKNKQHAFQVTKVGSAGTFTLLIEGSLDDVNWYQISSVSASGISQVSGLYPFVRARVSSMTAPDLISVLYTGSL